MIVFDVLSTLTDDQVVAIICMFAAWLLTDLGVITVFSWREAHRAAYDCAECRNWHCDYKVCQSIAKKRGKS